MSSPLAVAEVCVDSNSDSAGKVARIEALEQRVMLAGDVVLEWNSIAMNALRTDTTHPGPTWASRNLAMMHAAMFDAVNAINGQYEPYLVNMRAPRQTSMTAAAASAAHHVLETLYPSMESTFDAALGRDLAAIPDNPRKSMGVELGHYVAEQILAARAEDGSATDDTYIPKNMPGSWQPTAPDGSPALGANWPGVTPFVIEDLSDFRAPPPPAMNSAEYTAAFNEVKRLGAANSTERTAEQTEIAIFWAYDYGAMGTPVVLFNQIGQRVARQTHNSLVENARLFALLNLAMGDAGISAWDTKYTYDFWRPVTGIQQGETDGNDETEGDAGWMPLGVPGAPLANITPRFPAYTSGHSTFGAAAFRVLARFYGTDRMTFTIGSDELPGVKRTFKRFSDAAAENGISRIYLGVHWSFDNVAGKRAGSAIGDYVFEHALQRRHAHHAESAPALLIRPAPGGVFSTRHVATLDELWA